MKLTVGNMKTTLTYYKNSNTGELVMKQHSDLTGFVEISEKKFNRESKLMARSLNCA